jgi:hypothetical protein
MAGGGSRNGWQHRCTNIVINLCLNRKIVENTFVPLAPGVQALTKLILTISKNKKCNFSILL